MARGGFIDFSIRTVLEFLGFIGSTGCFRSSLPSPRKLSTRLKNLRVARHDTRSLLPWCRCCPNTVGYFLSRKKTTTSQQLVFFEIWDSQNETTFQVKGFHQFVSDDGCLMTSGFVLVDSLPFKKLFHFIPFTFNLVVRLQHISLFF